MLEQLSPEVQSRLRSGVAITSVAQAVEELVLNSIDAEATCVATRVDMSCCKIQVVDNGRGISRDALEKIAERYTTSKCHTLQDLDERLQHFGYRGEALASMRDMSSILEIDSRSKQCSQSFTRIFQNGKPHPVSESKNHRPSPGTTITVHNLFSSLPVRRKALNESLELERVRQRIEAIALIHPNCSFSLRNDVTGTKVLQTHKSNSVLGAFTFLFGNGKARMMTQVSAETGPVKINGFIGKESNHNKNIQFIFINDRLVLKTKIHRLINYQISRSSITRRRGGSDGSPKFISTDKSGSPSRPTSERHGIYVISVTCPLTDYDITYDPAKTLVEFKDWRTILASIRGMVYEFLIGHSLIVKADPRDDDNDDGSEYKDMEEALQADSQEEGSGDPGPIAALQRYAAGITTTNSGNNLASETVSRPRDTKPEEIAEQIIAEKTEEEKIKNRATEEIQSEESVEDVPGSSLTEATSGRPPSSPIFNDNDSKSEAGYREHSMSGKSPLSFMYKTSQESDTNDSINKGQETTPDEAMSGKDGDSPTSSCRRSENTASISDTAGPRVRDKTFISLDVSPDSSPDIISKASMYSELSEYGLFKGEKIDDSVAGPTRSSNSTQSIDHRGKRNSSPSSFYTSGNDNTQQPIPAVRRLVALRHKEESKQDGDTHSDSSGSLVLQTSSLEDFKRSLNKSSESRTVLKTSTSSLKPVRDESAQRKPSRKLGVKESCQFDSQPSTSKDKQCPISPQRALEIMRKRRHVLKSQDTGSTQNSATSVIYRDSLGDFKKMIKKEKQTTGPASMNPRSSQSNPQIEKRLNKSLAYEGSSGTVRNKIKCLETVKRSDSANADIDKPSGETLQSQDSTDKHKNSSPIFYNDSLGDFKKKISQGKQAAVLKSSDRELYKGKYQIGDPLISLTSDGNSATAPGEHRQDNVISTSSSHNVSTRSRHDIHPLPTARAPAAPKPKQREEQSQDAEAICGRSGSLVLLTSSLEDFKRSINSIGTKSTADKYESVHSSLSRKPLNKDASKLNSTGEDPCTKAQQRRLTVMSQGRLDEKTQDSSGQQYSSSPIIYSDSLADFKKKLSQEKQGNSRNASHSVTASELYEGQTENPVTLKSSSSAMLSEQIEQKEGVTTSKYNVSSMNQEKTHQIAPIRRLVAAKPKSSKDHSQDDGTNRGSLLLLSSSMEDFKRSLKNENQVSRETSEAVGDKQIKARLNRKRHSSEGSNVEKRGQGLNLGSTEITLKGIKSVAPHDKKIGEEVQAKIMRRENAEPESSKTAKCDEVIKPHALHCTKALSMEKQFNPQGQSVAQREDKSVITHHGGPTSHLEIKEPTENIANRSEKPQLQIAQSCNARNSQSSSASETDKMRRCQEAVSTDRLPLATKLSRLSRGQTETICQPPQITRREIGISILDQMVEDTQAALRKARAAGACKGTRLPDNITQCTSTQSYPKRKLSAVPTGQPSVSVMGNTSNSDSEAMNRPKSEFERNIERKQLPNVQEDKPCPSTHGRDPSGTPTLLSEGASACDFKSPAVREANECYKAKLYENPFPFSATPVIPLWKEKTCILWSTSDDEEEIPSTSTSTTDWTPSIKRQKIQMEEKSIVSNSQPPPPEEWKRIQLQTSPVRRIPPIVVDKPSKDENASKAIEDKNREFGTALSVPSKCEEDPVVQESEDIADVGNSDTENIQNELVVEKIKESNRGMDCNTDEHSPGELKLQTLDYSIEFESLHKMVISNMELGSQPGDSPFHGENTSTSTSQPSTSQSPCRPKPTSPVNTTVSVEPSQGFVTLSDDATTEVSGERSQGFLDVQESQGYVVKDETQRFTPPLQQYISDEKSKDDGELIHGESKDDREEVLTDVSLPSSEKVSEKDGERISPEVQSKPEIASKSPEKTLFVGPSWICKLDPNTGRKVFINKITGHSSFSSPKASFTDDENRRPVVHIKNPILPSGATPLLQAESSPLQARPRALRVPQQAASTSKQEEEESHLSAALAGHLDNQQQEEINERGIKWRQGSLPSSDGQTPCVRSMLEEWDNPVFKNVEQCSVSVDTRSSAQGASRVQQAIHPYKLDKDVLQTIKVLGQLDNKFIACLLDQPSSGGGGRQELLAVIDQHAAHERVRLERLTAEAYADDGTCINRRDIDPAVIISLKEEEVRVACAYRSALQKKGISFKVDSTKRTVIRVHEVPACLVERDLGENKRRRAPIAVDTLEMLITEETEMLNSTHGAGATIPQTVFRALCSQACHGAIKFGDPLTTAECENLVKQLAMCKLPFQCAHGRPSVMPILDLSHLNLHQTKEPQIKLWKLRQSLDK